MYESIEWKHDRIKEEKEEESDEEAILEQGSEKLKMKEINLSEVVT